MRAPSERNSPHALAQPRPHSTRAWTEAGGGFELFKEAFDGALLPMILSAVSNTSEMLSTVRAVQPSCRVRMLTRRAQDSFDLAAVSGGGSLLTHQGSGYATYAQSLYYLGTLPIGLANETLASWQVATQYESSAPASFKSYSCKSVTITERCASISPPPPPKAPPAPRARDTGAFYVGNVTAMNINAVTAVGPGARRRLAQSSAAAAASGGPMCTVYYREVSFLSMLTLAATPPDSCGGGYCANTTWSYAPAPACSTLYTPVTLPIDAATYAADMADGFAWCSEWPSMFTPVHAGVSVRSIDDPYLAGGALTDCTYVFKQAGAAYANVGFFFIIPGMAVSLVAFFCLEGMCTPRSVGAFGGGSEEEEGGQAPLGWHAAPSYGAATPSVELAQGVAGGGDKWNK